MPFFQAKYGELIEPPCFGSRHLRRSIVDTPSEPTIGDDRYGHDHGEQGERGKRRQFARAMADAVASSRARP